MIAKAAVHFDASTFLLIAATVLFVLSVTRYAKAWMLGIGLACFSAAFWLTVFID